MVASLGVSPPFPDNFFFGFLPNNDAPGAVAHRDRAGGHPPPSLLSSRENPLFDALYTHAIRLSDLTDFV